MKREHLEKLLLETTEEETKVSDRLHQDIMRSVKLAGPVAGKTRTDWRIPVFGTAMSMLLFYFLQIAAVNPIPSGEQEYPGSPLINTPLTTLEDQLNSMSQHTLIAEKELMAELERLKSDLKRFDFRS